MIFVYIILFGIVCVIVKQITDSIDHKKRVNAGRKAYRTRIHNIRYIPVNLSGKKYKIKRDKRNK